VSNAFRSELLKQRTTRTVLALFAAMVGLVALAVVLHGVGLPVDALDDRSRQLIVLGLGGFLGSLFAALLGALSITSEIRHGTIRPTFLVTPQRSRVVAAKAVVCVLVGAAFGLVAAVIAIGTGTTTLDGRGVEVLVNIDDAALLVAGGTIASALWAAIGVGVGAIVRRQVPTLVGLCAWLLFVEGLLADATGGLGEVGRYLPGAAAAAISGQEPDRLLAPALGLAVLGLYTAGSSLLGAFTMSRRDVE
jgi:ABC-type transport system involved in multi-copper enzyme maturation permease subunit